MGIGIKIEKIKTEKLIHYYRVHTYQEDEEDFYIGINPATKILYVFNTDNFSVSPVYSIDLADNKASFEVPGVRKGVVLRVLAKVLRAVEKNDFPSDLGWYS